ncbi:MAG: hypothetical protein IKM78_05975 [Prevotella sp.]|nr:hypothetical protein [Prevotella sp.]
MQQYLSKSDQRELSDEKKSIVPFEMAQIEGDQNGWGGERAGTPIIINSGYRSPQLNKRIGGVPTSNHLTGCAVDIRVDGMEQLIRYAAILLDYADETHNEFDELLIEKNRYGAIWLHFAVRPKGNRHKVMFINTN